MHYRIFIVLFLMVSAAPSYADSEADVAANTPATVVKKAVNPDPWENFNRAIFRFNDTLDQYALKPAAKGYKKITPNVVQTGISNFFENLRSPIVMLNDLLQGKIKQAGQDTARFVINSTVGVVGFMDVAKHIPLPAHDEDFGQTLGKWGVKSGPYVVLPFFGPSSARDAVGFGGDTLSNPRRYLLDWKVDLGLTAVDAVDARARLLDVESIIQGDRYLFIRDLYLQRRNFLIHDGQVDDPFLDDNFDEPTEPTEPPTDSAAPPMSDAVEAPSSTDKPADQDQETSSVLVTAPPEGEALSQPEAVHSDELTPKTTVPDALQSKSHPSESLK